MKDLTSQNISPMIAWANEFACTWGDLVVGQMDFHDTLDWAYELWPTQGSRAPEAVAKEEYLADLAEREAEIAR